MNSRLLTFEVLDDGDVVEIHMDRQGAECLMRALEDVLENGGHTHLIAPSWAGQELTEEKQNVASRIAKKVTLFVWEESDTTDADHGSASGRGPKGRETSDGN